MVSLLRLLQGLDVNEDGYVYRNYKLKELIAIGMEKWQQLITLTLLELDDLFGENKFTKEELGQITIYEAICFSPLLREWAIDFLNTFLLGEWEFNELFSEFVCYSFSSPLVVNKQNLETVFENIRQIYCIGKPKPEYDISKATGSEVLDMLKEFEEIKKKQNKEKEPITYESIVESISVKHPSYNLMNIWDLTLHQLMRTYYRMEHIDNYNHVLQGIYSGAISSKDIKMKEIHWSKRITA